MSLLKPFYFYFFQPKLYTGRYHASEVIVGDKDVLSIVEVKVHGGMHDDVFVAINRDFLKKTISKRNPMKINERRIVPEYKTIGSLREKRILATDTKIKNIHIGTNLTFRKLTLPTKSNSRYCNDYEIL